MPALAGPFDLGTVVVRAAINVDPHTAQVTLSSDPLPTMLDGIPLDIRTINVTIDREGFTFNPTSCEPMSITGTIMSAEGATANVSSRFQAANCAALPFKPTFSASTQGKTSRIDGASLITKVTYPSTPQGTEANIAKVHVELPKALPSRLTTLQKACTESEFNTNPASCPAASIVGHAIAHTPILNHPLEGPAYFVSHGNAKFPELIMVLQGEGITIDLAGETDIKNGITSSTFAHVPDAPVSTFELTLPEGPYSALSANGNLCQQKLVMPTSLVGQNGAEIHQSTQIQVEGCSNSVSVVSHKVKGRSAVLTIVVPAAGKLKASGKGLSSVSKSSSGRETITITVHQKRGGKLHTSIKLKFTPSKGKGQSKSLAVSFKG